MALQPSRTSLLRRRVVSALLSVVALSASASAAQDRPQLKLAVPVANVSGIELSRADFFTEALGTQLSKAGAEVTTPQQIAAALGLERQRQLLGCAEGESCMAELTAALGADGIVTTNVALLDGTFHVTLKLMASGGRLLWTEQTSVASSAAVLDVFARHAPTLVQRGAELLGCSLRPARSGLRWALPAGLVALGLGVATGVGSAVCFAQRGQLEDNFRRLNGPVELAVAQRWATDGKAFQGAAWGLAVASLVSVGFGLAATLLGLTAGP